jgi:L-asparaginase / beta-aspartyl-peptidase
LELHRVPASASSRKRARAAIRRDTRLMPRPVLAIHGGAGLGRGSATPRHRAALERALDAGWKVLAGGGSSLDAVAASVVALEDHPLFNAGRGAVYNAERKHELDASIMDGASLRAGAVAAVSGIRNPILAARMCCSRARGPNASPAGRDCRLKSPRTSTRGQGSKRCRKI